MASLAVTIIMIFLLLFENSFSLIVIPHLFILSMTTFSLSSLLQAHLAGVSTTSERDILLGLYFTLGQGVSSLWSTLLGSLVDLYSFNAIWVTMVSASVSAMVCLIISYKIFMEKRAIKN
jgi:predicted MFS family arabinose efflux permease